MEYFVYCRDRPGTAALREELGEAHWSFMDGYADAMIARGPTLTPDGTAATGSMHIVDLPNARAAHVFAFEEPNYRAGVYGEVLVRRWRSALGGTMWDFQGDPAGNARFLIIGHSAADAARDDALDADSATSSPIVAGTSSPAGRCSPTTARTGSAAGGCDRTRA